MDPLRKRAVDLAGPYLEDWKRNTQARAGIQGKGRTKHG